MSKTYWKGFAVFSLLIMAYVISLENSSFNTTSTSNLNPGVILPDKPSRSAIIIPSLEEATKLIEQREQEELVAEELEFQRSGKPKRIRVCTIALNPRQGSLFRTNYLGDMGSGRYKYIPRMSCPWDWPRVRLISFVKCCTKLSQVRRTINVANDEYDIIIVTGDEYCKVTDPRAHFRQYHGTSVMQLSKNMSTTSYIENFYPDTMMNSNQYPIYIPLGPREEFLYERITSFANALDRKYTYNFLGSMTSQSRAVLRNVLGADMATPEMAKRFPGFLHITDKWHLKVTASNGYIEPDKYKQVLLDSVFTLCPTGHNPEAYRIYEALEAGSIPILGIDPWYRRAACHESFKPFHDANAPLVYLNNGWQGLQEFLMNEGSNRTWIAERQRMCVNWYRDWMHKTALRFEALLEFRYQNRMQNKREEQEHKQALGAAGAEEENDLQTDEELAVLQEEEDDGESEQLVG